MLIRLQIKQHREAKGFTQGQLATAAGVSSNYIWMLENGHRRLPSDDVLGRLSGALGVPASHLISVSGESSISA